MLLDGRVRLVLILLWEFKNKESVRACDLKSVQTYYFPFDFGNNLWLLLGWGCGILTEMLNKKLNQNQDKDNFYRSASWQTTVSIMNTFIKKNWHVQGTFLFHCYYTKNYLNQRSGLKLTILDIFRCITTYFVKIRNNTEHLWKTWEWRSPWTHTLLQSILSFKKCTSCPSEQHWIVFLSFKSNELVCS